LWAPMVLDCCGLRDGVSMPIRRTPRLASSSPVSWATAVKFEFQVVSGAC
jgi:hypothetical protein